MSMPTANHETSFIIKLIYFYLPPTLQLAHHYFLYCHSIILPHKYSSSSHGSTTGGLLVTTRFSADIARFVLVLLVRLVIFRT